MLPGKKYGVADYVGLIQRSWWLIATTSAVGLFAALIVSSTLHDSYQSEMLVQIVPQRVPDEFVRQIITESTEDRMTSLEAQVKSRSQLERLIREYNLYPVERTRAPMEDVVATMREAIKVELIRPMRHLPADAFYVRYTYGDPALSAKVTSSLGQLFIAKNASERVTMANSANQFLEQQLVTAKERLEEAEGKVEQFRQANAGKLPTQSDHNMGVIQSTQVQLTALIESTARDRDRRLMLERLYNDKLKEPLPTSPLQAAPAAGEAAAATMPAKQQLALAKAQLTQLERRLTDEHPDLRRQRRIVADLEAQVGKEVASAEPTPTQPVGMTNEELIRRDQLAQQKAEIESLDRQIAFKETAQATMRKTISDYQARLEAIPGVESEWVALTRDYDTLKSSYESLLKKAEDSKVAANLEERQVGEQFRIVDPAVVPVRPVGPVRLQVNAIGLMAGGFIGIAAVALMFLRDTTFHSEADVLDVLSLRVLAQVPLVIDAAETRRRLRRRVLMGSAVGIAMMSCGYVAWSMQLWKYLA